jgi:hypothetical protein
MKPLKKSRTVWAGNILAAIGVVQAAIVAAPAGSLSPGLGWWMSVGCAAATVLLGGTVVGLRVSDARRSRTAADLLIERDTKSAKAAAKAAAKLGLLLLVGCGPHWQVCEVDLSNHPVKPAPAASARVRCSRTVLCDVAEGARCDGELLAKGAK